MSKNKGVLFLRVENGESKWFENGDENKMIVSLESVVVIPKN